MITIGSLLLVVLGSLSSVVSAPAHTRILTFEERVEAQRAIERVYYSHQVGATRPFEEVVPEELVERKVLIYLKQSVALDEVWHTPITAAMLQAELARMVAGSQLPERLEEIYAALGHDPLLVMECFVRPVLAERLTHNFLVHNGSLPDEPDRGPAVRRSAPERTWDDWWQKESPRFDEHRVRAIDPAPGALLTAPKPSVSPEPTCAPGDRWDNGSLSKLPQFGEGPAVWTGTHMLVVNSSPLLKYDPLTDTWATSGVPNPSLKTERKAVWTGSALIVWGGSSPTVNTGFRYDPVADTWQPTSTVGAPTPRWGHSLVWTGSRMIVWGGGGTNTGGLYDPVTDTWTSMSTIGAPEGRLKHSAVWTGDRMIVWGGGGGTAILDTGGLYDPATDTWRPTSMLDAPSPRLNHSAVWTGDRMIVWGGGDSLDTGGVYDPGTDTWRPTSTTDAPEGRANHEAFWTGREMLVWGGDLVGPNIYGPAGAGGRYDPATDTWAPVSTLNQGPARTYPAVVWTGDRMVMFGGLDAVQWLWLSVVPLYSGGRYDPVADFWTPTAATTNGPSPPRRGLASVWTGNEMIVWGGCDDYLSGSASGMRYDPVADAWRPMSMIDAPEGRCDAAVVWTGNEMILWGGVTYPTGGPRWLSSGGRYDPLADRWEAISEVGAPQARSDASGVWTGERMIVWGGGTNTGGLYDLSTDTWSSTSTVGAPEGRLNHAAIWTGNRMLVWGGDLGASIAYDTGGLYDPVTDTWQPTSLIDAPSARTGHAWAWTGSEMFVFSGAFNYKSPVLDDGALYDPVLDRWRPISDVGTAPPGRAQAAVWTGREVLVWGAPTRGGRYDPEDDTWRPMSTAGAPDTRNPQALLWSGTHMLLWDAEGFGGRYVAYDPPDDDGDGYTTCDGDCNDADPAVNPAAAELPGNRVDENCDGVLACDPDAAWRNNGQFVSCVARACDALVARGAVSAGQCMSLVSKAARLQSRPGP